MELQYNEQAYRPPVSAQSLFGNYLLQVAPEIKPRTERESYIQMFHDKLNADRAASGRKPLRFMAYKMKLAHLSDLDVKDFYYQCEKSRSGFGKCYWGALKVRKIPDLT